MNTNNNPPDWATAPEWANYVAMDADGEWFWYEQAPREGANLWYPVEGLDTRVEDVYTYWRETLHSRPVSESQELPPNLGDL